MNVDSAIRLKVLKADITIFRGLDEVSTIAECYRLTLAESMLIRPGPPWRNTLAEPFTRTLRDELVAIEVFHTQFQAKVVVVDYRQRYNTCRLWSSPSFLTPD